MRTKIIALAITALSFLGLTTSAPAAEAAQWGSSKICNSAYSFTYIRARDIVSGASNNLTAWPGPGGGSIGECTSYHYGPNWRVDTDPMGASHSYRTRYDVYIGGGWNIGNWNGCHYNSDNHSSDPADPDSGATWRIIYQNYDHGDCTN